jgi:uncharacterized membrane protein YgcG
MDAALVIRSGHCGHTRGRGRCSGPRATQMGAWVLQPSARFSYSAAVDACLALCAGCSQCAFVSVSPERRDCSWYARGGCNAVHTDIEYFVTLPRNASGSSAFDGAVAEMDARFNNGPPQRQRRLVEAIALQLDALPQRIGPQPSPPAAHPLLLALGVLSLPAEANRRAYVRRSLRHSQSDAHETASFAYRFVIGTSGLSAVQAARLASENAQQADLALLADARDNRKQYLSEKVLRWLQLALRLFPKARFYGKSDTDVYVVWPRLAPRLLLEPLGTRTIVGLIEWASYLPAERRFCGCCAATFAHAQILQSDRRAHFGSCEVGGGGGGGGAGGGGGGGGGGGRHNNMTTTHVGPYRFAQGAFYALSSALVREVTHAATHALREMNSGELIVKRGEDLMTGRLIHMLKEPRAVRSTSWPKSSIHNFDEASYPSGYGVHGRGQPDAVCLRAHNISGAMLTTGSRSRWGTAETLGPMSAVVHRVSHAAQWRRAWALATHWNRVLGAHTSGTSSGAPPPAGAAAAGRGASGSARAKLKVARCLVGHTGQQCADGAEQAARGLRSCYLPKRDGVRVGHRLS